MSGWIKALVVVVVAVGLAVSLSACGRKGELESPPGKDPSYPRTYPAPDRAPDNRG